MNEYKRLPMVVSAYPYTNIAGYHTNVFPAYRDHPNCELLHSNTGNYLVISSLTDAKSKSPIMIKLNPDQYTHLLNLQTAYNRANKDVEDVRKGMIVKPSAFSARSKVLSDMQIYVYKEIIYPWIKEKPEHSKRLVEVAPDLRSMPKRKQAVQQG